MTNQIHKNFISYNDQTIVALCSPQGPGAIGLIRFSGVDVFDVVDQLGLLASGKKLSEQSTHTIGYGWVVDKQKQPIDQVLFLIMHAPRTFTGQNVIEITCHNNQFLIEKIIDRALECGARLAGNGEFTQRAVMLGKMDLLQAEAVNDLIHAQTAESLKYSLQQLQGSLSSWIAEIEVAVLEILAFCEGSFEFLDEELEFASDIEIRLLALTEKIQKLLKTFSKQQYIKEGIRIALIGCVNAGKSSLFNGLLAKKRSIVTAVPGTTRDSIEAGMFRDGEFLTFIDTAGIRKTDDVIEQEGIDRSFEQAAHADIILLVLDGSTCLSGDVEIAYRDVYQKYCNKIIVVHNKIDLGIAENILDFDGKAVRVCAQLGSGVDDVYSAIKKKVEDLKGSDAITCLLNKRQHDLLVKFQEQLFEILPMVQRRRIDYELVSCQLKEALQSLSEMTGRSISQTALDKVFQTFCVGK